jgi:RHS repeat-associated protein
MVHADHLNRPTRLTDATRATVWQASYDPFGQPVAITGPVEQNLRFPGQYFVIETGLSYNWHRFYDPTTGRYTQPDPLRFVDGPSLYGYAGQSPMMWVDPEGTRATLFPRPQPMVPVRPSPTTPRGGSPGAPITPPMFPSPEDPDTPEQQCTPENPTGRMPPIDRPGRPGGGRCACTGRAGDANVGLWGFGTAVASRCNVAAQLACKAAVNSYDHHASAKCPDGNSDSGSGAKLGGT